MAKIIEMDVHDKERIERLLNHEPSFNRFVISDLDYEEYKRDYVRICGEIDGNQLLSLLLIFREKIVYYSPYDRSVDCYLHHVRQANVSKLVGKKTLVDLFIPHLDIQQRSDCQVRELTSLPHPPADSQVTVKRLKSREEAARLYDLFVQVEEYGFTNTDKNRYIEEQMKCIENDSIRTYFSEVDGEMVSTAAYMNDRPRTAIVVGVATPPQHRKKGYASHVLYRLCSEAVHAQKALYLFYTNPHAGAVYERLGFRAGGEWAVLIMRTN